MHVHPERHLPGTMKFLHWMLIALFLAVPYGNQGIVGAFMPRSRPEAGKSLFLQRAERTSPDLRNTGSAKERHVPVPQQVSAKNRYRSAFLIHGFKPGRSVLAFQRSDGGRDRVCPQFLDDIFHPPA
jgi:hypothetical protein